MTKKYSCERGLSFGVFLLAGSLILLGVAYGLPLLLHETTSIKIYIIKSLIVIPLPGVFLWGWLDTYYLIDNETLIAKCGPFIWRVAIRKITIIRLNQKTIGGTLKPTLSWNSIEIRYNYRSIYITPQKQDSFISELKIINDKIEIKQN
jgi:hypothetical protein